MRVTRLLEDEEAAGWLGLGLGFVHCGNGDGDGDVFWKMEDCLWDNIGYWISDISGGCCAVFGVFFF